MRKRKSQDRDKTLTSTTYGYCRVSSKKQVLGTSLESQQMYMEKLGIVSENLVLEVGSSRLNDLPIKKELFKKLRPGDSVHCTDATRFGRNLIQCEKEMLFLEHNGINVFINGMLVSGTPEGKLSRRLLFVFGEHENDSILLRSTKGIKRKMETKTWTGGRPTKISGDKRLKENIVSKLNEKTSQGKFKYSYRDVSALLRVSLSTIYRSYSTLLKEGLVESRK